MNKKVILGLLAVAVSALVACNNATVSEGGAGNPSPNPSTSTGNKDSRLIGTWNTGCLTPDADSPYSEKHTFVIMEDGETAVKTDINYDKQNCIGNTIVNKSTSFVLEIKGRVNEAVTETLAINLTAAGGDTSGSTLYDIYQVTGTTLLFGHGFRNLLSYAGAESGGVTEAGRISTLNQYLVYKK